MVRAEDTSRAARRGVRSAVGEERRLLQRRAVHAVCVPPRRRAAEEHDSASGRHRRRQLGRRGGRSRTPGYVFVNAHDTSLVGWLERKKPGKNYGRGTQDATTPYDRASVDGAGPYFSFSAPLKNDAGQVACDAACYRPPWSQAHGRRREHRARSPGRARSALTEALPQAEAAHGRQRQCRAERDRRRAGLRRRDQRRAVPCVRRRERQGAVGRQARREVNANPMTYRGRRRQAICRGRGGRWARRVLAALMTAERGAIRSSASRATPTRPPRASA